MVSSLDFFIARKAVAVLRETFRLGYHPGALRHPSCSRRGAGISNKTTTPLRVMPHQKLMRSWPWRERSPFLFVVTPNVPAANEGVPGVGWLKTLLVSIRTWTLFDSLTLKVLLAPMSRVQFPKYLKFPKPRLPTSPGVEYFSSTSPGVPSALRRATATIVQTLVAWRFVPILSPAATCEGSVH